MTRGIAPIGQLDIASGGNQKQSNEFLRIHGASNPPAILRFIANRDGLGIDVVPSMTIDSNTPVEQRYHGSTGGVDSAGRLASLIEFRKVAIEIVGIRIIK
ncbi:MAG: hypothetical protein O7G85_00595 [Planctomycetota bacterium]|nr:hypothetical protein [Planctomycetota bacterium]